MKFERFFDITPSLQAGVYILCWRGAVVYVGKSKKLYARIYSHRTNWAASRRKALPAWAPIKAIRFDEVHIRPCMLEQLDELEREYITKYRPRHNVYLQGRQEAAQAPISVTIGGVSVLLNAITQPKPSPGLIRRRL